MDFVFIREGSAYFFPKYPLFDGMEDAYYCYQMFQGLRLFQGLHLFQSLEYVVPVKSKVKILQNFVAFSEYMNFNFHEGKTWLHIYFDSDPNDVIVYIRPSISLSIILLQRKRIWGLPPGQPIRDQQRSTWCIEKALCSNLQKNVLKILVMVVVFCKI